MKFTKIAISCTLLVSMLGSAAFAAPQLTTSSQTPQIETKDSAEKGDNKNENNRWNEQRRNNGNEKDEDRNWKHENDHRRDHKHHEDGSNPAQMKIETTAVKATVAGTDISGTIDGRTATLKMPISGALSMIKIEGTDGVTLTVDKVKAANAKTINKEMVFPDMHQISIAEILGNPANASIDVTTLRAALGDSGEIVVSGTLSKADYKSKNVKLILDFSKTIGEYSNSYIDAVRSGKTVTVGVKQPDALISEIGMKNMILGVSQSAAILPVSVSLGEGADKVTYKRLLDPATQDAIRDKVGTICGTWATATLSDLAEQNDQLNMKLNVIGSKSISIDFAGQ